MIPDRDITPLIAASRVRRAEAAHRRRVVAQLERDGIIPLAPPAPAPRPWGVNWIMLAAMAANFAILGAIVWGLAG